eukprot:TRINITY_DN48467_c0_g1_i1.p1 TRINITY_DN48467_c0_g1~~TRINITY_DN48467_c0_g1_i1.p1  ORF type:complete len:343 (+),score=94.92 TRINITY_DN48467_c0_g1_i1:65-1030(+)
MAAGQASEWRKLLEERMEQEPSTGAAIHAVSVLTEHLRRSKAKTLQELQDGLEEAAGSLQHGGGIVGRYRIPLLSSCDLFVRYVTRMTHADMAMDIPDIRQLLTKRAEEFESHCRSARDRIASHLGPFLRDNVTVLVHGLSHTAMHAIIEASQLRRIHVLVTESRPDCAGYGLLEGLKGAESEKSVHAELILDAAVASRLGSADFVLLGAEGVSASGGVVNKIGSYQIAVLARALQKPVYIATESFKFLRLFPLDQGEVPQPDADDIFTWVGDAKFPPVSGVEMSRKAVDYIPPEYITRLYTDLGILPPSAVSDELIKLYT